MIHMEKKLKKATGFQLKGGKTFKEKSVEILGFEITDRTNNKIYTSDGQIQDISNSKDEMER